MSVFLKHQERKLGQLKSKLNHSPAHTRGVWMDEKKKYTCERQQFIHMELGVGVFIYPYTYKLSQGRVF